MEEPTGADRVERLTAVLGVVYLMFNEGYSATAGQQWTRPALCDEAVRLGRILTALMPGEAEVHGLAALMELQSSRLRARIGADGQRVLLADQDRSRWDQSRIQRGLTTMRRAEALTSEDGPYVLQAAIAACRARAAAPEETDWAIIASLYERLSRVNGTPVIELNRAVALSMAYGAGAGLALLDQIADEPALRGYHLLSSVRGDLLQRLGRHKEARAEFERAAAMPQNVRERELLLDRAARADAGQQTRPLVGKSTRPHLRAGSSGSDAPSRRGP